MGSTRAGTVAAVLAAVACLLAGIAWLGYRFADPAPPSHFTITSATKGSPYYNLAERYAATFRRNSIRFENRESDGAVPNFEVLSKPGTGVDAGFVQGGLFSAKDAPGLVSVGRVAYEPLWLFYAGAEKLERLSDLKGRRVLVGPAGGGTNGLALKLLAANGVTAETATLINRPLPDYVEMLGKGEADAGFLVLAAEARTVQRLLATPGVSLFSFTNADAYTQKFPYLTKLEMREGVVNLGDRVPPHDATLLATTAAVLVRREAHPALVNLLAQAVHDAHATPTVDANGQSALFNKVGEFPTSVDPEFPMSDEARRVYRSGAPFLQRYLPFWLATMIDRLAVSLVVVLPLLIPLTRMGPQVYRWSVRRRLLKWYSALKVLERHAKIASSPADRAAQLDELDRIEHAVDEVPIPFGFTDQLFELRQHIDTVRRRITGRNGSGLAAAGAASSGAPADTPAPPSAASSGPRASAASGLTPQAAPSRSEANAPAGAAGASPDTSTAPAPLPATPLPRKPIDILT